MLGDFGGFMDTQTAKSMLLRASKELNNAGILSSFLGSISMRHEHANFFTNKADALFSQLSCDDFMLLGGKKDYRWKDACKDALIHQNIYKNITIAKFVCLCVPSYITSYSIEFSSFEPRDIVGKELFINNLFIYDTKQSEDWLERAPSEIVRYFLQNNTNVVILKGAGICAYDRTLSGLLRTIFTLENSAKLLFFSQKMKY